MPEEPKVIKIRARKWEFWKPFEKVVVICNHDWEEIDRTGVQDRYNVYVHILLKCKKCGKLVRKRI